MRKLLLALALICFGGAAHATCPVIPFIFTNGTPINASQVNDNFSTLRDCITTATGLTQVSSSSALRALAAGIYPMVYRQYNTTPGDGSAFYTWTPGSSCVDDGINCIKPATNPVTGRWVISDLAAGNMTATGNATVGGTATVTGSASVMGDFQAGASATIGTTLSTGGGAAFGGAVTVASNNSITVAGTGGYQVGGSLGPFMINDGAADTISFQALPGALPSTDTTNVQLYPPAVGGKAFLNITKSAILSPANEERLILGTDGSNYILQQVISGAGTCHNVAFMDGQSATPAFSLICGGGGVPSLAIGKLGALIGESSIAFEGMLQIDGSDNLVLGQGTNIQNIVTSHPIQVGSGSIVLNVATPTVGAGKISIGTTTDVAANCGAIAGSTGCWVINVGGTARAIPFF